MGKLAIFSMIGGAILIWLSKRYTDQQLRKIGTGLIIAGVVMLLLNRLDIPLGPGS